MKRLTAWLAALFLLISANGLRADGLPIIDAHSQADEHIGFDEIIELMDRAGVSRTILTLRGRRQPEELAGFASRHPDRITPAVRTKGGMNRPKEEFKRFFRKQMRMLQFGAMAEVLMWHAEKRKASVVRGDGTMGPPPKVVFPPDHPRVQGVLAAAIKRGWPFVAHIEFTNIPTVVERNEFMDKFENLLRQHPDHPFLLNNMGYLDVNHVKRFIEEHPNIGFIPSWTNPVALKVDADQPFVNMFEGTSLAPEWRELIVDHRDRFVFGLDIIMSGHWRKLYVPQVALWRKALKELPNDVAHAVVHANAEKLWRLPPPQ
ncbi:MAG: amidohydrolase family protein [Deltaproteobacteria bacterium]|nr:MAG: amidohydrolase family protein [Deltaproteobacteria bacterium]